MSFSEPSGNVIAISSGDIEIASGTIKIEINLSDKSGSFGDSYDMEVTDLTSIEVDYNFISDIGDVNEFKINLPSLEFEILDTVRNSNLSSDTALFVEMLTELDASDLVVSRITFNGSSDYYYTTREQTEFSYSNRKVKIKAQHPLFYKAQPYGKTWGSQISPSKLITVRQIAELGFTEITDAFLARDLIEQYVSHLSDSGTLIYSSDLYEYNASSYSSIQDFDVDFIFRASNTVVETSFASATTAVKNLALSDGAIIGNILGYGFYVGRYKKEFGASLSSDDFLEIELDYNFKNIRNFSLSISYGDSDYPTDSISITDQPINEDGLNDASLTFASEENGFIICEAGLADGVPLLEYYYDPGSPSSPTVSPSISSSTENKIINAYKDVLRIPRSIGSVDAGSYISGKIIGVDTLKPYEYFSVSYGVHPMVNGRDFRPSYLKYDLINDIIEFEAYEF